MNRGLADLEALLAAAIALVLVAVMAAQLYVFWHAWHAVLDQTRQRQWSVLAFTWLEDDVRNASRVVVTTDSIRIEREEGVFTYRVSSAGNSFHRVQGSTFAALAVIEGAMWWQEGGLLWVKLIYPGGASYRACFALPQP